MSHATIITLRYDLHSLPTAQHKAGLAGLCIHADTLNKRNITPLPVIETGHHGNVTVELTKESLATLLNDLYDAAWEEVECSQKRKDKAKNEVPPLREETRVLTDPKTGKEKQKKVYIYEDVVPKAAFFDSFQLKVPWIKLWRNAIWSTLRGIPATRTPYNERAEGKTPKEVDKIWKVLQSYSKKPLKTDGIASSIFIGAQDKNADKISFVGSPDENFLLNFWSIVARVFVPEIIDFKGERKFLGYIFTIPEVSDVIGFMDEFAIMMAQLSADMHGYRPKEAVVSVPQEGALEYIAGLVRNKAGSGNISYNISAIDYYHLEKQGNNIKQLTAGSIEVDENLMDRYEAVRGYYKNSIFKAQIIRNLLEEKPDYSGFSKIMSIQDKDLFIGNRSWFALDAKKFFKLQQNNIERG